MPQPSSTVSSWIHLDGRRSSRRSASSASTFNSVQTACRLCAGSKAEASNDDGDDFWTKGRLSVRSVPTHLVRPIGKMTGEEQEMDYQSVVARTTDAERRPEKNVPAQVGSRHRWMDVIRQSSISRGATVQFRESVLRCARRELHCIA